MAGLFGKLAADTLGLSDIGKILEPKDFDKALVDDYISHEEGEEIFFVIKSQTDEYCFTNLAIWHLDGQLAVSKRRLLYKYDYFNHSIRNVKVETAGTIDLDCELKFDIVSNSGVKEFSIDILKNQEEQIKDIYKALHKISLMQEEGAIRKADRDLTLSTVKDSFSRATCDNKADTFRELLSIVDRWNDETYRIYHQKDFGDVYRLYINN